MRRILVVEPNGWPCKLCDCPPGFFLCEDQLCSKTEYVDDSEHRWTEAYNSAGEYFWGGDLPKEDREYIVVQPCAAEWKECE